MVIPPEARDLLPGMRNLQSGGTQVSDIFQVGFNMKSDIEASSVGYNLQVASWTENDVMLLLNFDVPTDLSRGASEDSISLRIVKPEIFKAQASEMVLASGEI